MVTYRDLVSEYAKTWRAVFELCEHLYDILEEQSKEQYFEDYEQRKIKHLLDHAIKADKVLSDAEVGI